jgi:hypothetical protein
MRSTTCPVRRRDKAPLAPLKEDVLDKARMRKKQRRQPGPADGVCAFLLPAPCVANRIGLSTGTPLVPLLVSRVGIEPTTR